MQQRYCQCGCRVWVQYVLSDSACRTVFWASMRFRQLPLSVCPRCGARLDIDELR